jgi:putative SOS response-associated peptidase YedK
MCGRVVQAMPMGRLAELMGAVPDPDATDADAAPRWNIAPSADLTTLTTTADGRRVLVRSRWGLVPHWAKDPSIGARLTNARSETAWEKPSFRDAMRRGRCVVPVDGFYEWAPATPDGPRTAAGRPAKRPHLFTAVDGGPLLVAAIASTWRDTSRPDGERLSTVCLLTTSANATMAPIHDRMPVLLDPAEAERWLDTPAADARDMLDGLLDPAPDALLVEHEVSIAVNDARRDGPELVEPVADTEPGTLF